jgi:hypothetical protein
LKVGAIKGVVAIRRVLMKSPITQPNTRLYLQTPPLAITAPEIRIAQTAAISKRIVILSRINDSI